MNSFILLNANIAWGTVADWAMVLATTASLILIWRTLKSQTKVQKIQTEMHGLELERERKKLIPSWHIPHKGKIGFVEHDQKFISPTYSVYFYLKKGEAKNISLVFKSESIELMENNIVYLGYANIESHLHINIKATISLTKGTPLRQSKYFPARAHTTICYEDMLGNHYEQVLDYSVSKEGKQHVILGTPVQLQPDKK